MEIPIGQQIERRYIRFALERAGVNVRSLEFSEDRSAVPDARLKLTDGRCIGIEQTQIRVPDKQGRLMSAREARHRYVMEQAEEAYNARCPRPRPLHVDVDFDGADIRDVASVAERIADLVRRFEQEAVPYVHVDLPLLWRRGWSIHDSLPFESMWIGYSERVTQACWAPSSGGGVPPLTPEVIQARIDAKGSRYERYAVGLDEVWLILTMESGSQATHLSLDALPADHVYPTRFSRVLLDQIVGAEIRELRVSVPPEQPQ